VKERQKTVYDIAHKAGVSAATVSRVLNQSSKVSSRTRERVLAIMRDSGFRPNRNARSLVRGGSGQICFLLSNRDVAHSFHSRILKGVEDFCKRQHQQVIFTSFDYPADSEPAPESLPLIVRESSGVEGVLLAGTNYPAFVKSIEHLKIPYVLFGNNLVSGSLALPRNAHAVCFDEQGGAASATQFLIELGHRQILFVGDLSKVWYRRRFEGYRTVMAERGLPVACADIQDEPDCFQLGERALPVMVREWPGTTAVLTQDDETACGILSGLRKLRIRVPEDISVVGYDDIAEVHYLSPALTTVRVPKEQIGSTMAEHLFRVIEGGVRRQPPVIATEIIIRESCARPRPA
jgi:LacI family transcriptional regulator, galactose operon repressor